MAVVTSASIHAHKVHAAQIGSGKEFILTNFPNLGKHQDFEGNAYPHLGGECEGEREAGPPPR